MADADEDELQRAFRMSLQQPVPEAKRSRPHETAASPSSTMSMSATDMRELRAKAAEQRMLAVASRKSLASPTPAAATGESTAKNLRETSKPLSLHEAEQLFNMVFGSSLSRPVLAQWCNQGFRFSPEQQTSLGLVQQEGGPCGVLAPVQALVLKHLIFVHAGATDGSATSQLHDKVKETDSQHIFTEIQRTRALVSAMAEILWLAGCRKKSIIAVLDIPGFWSGSDQQDEIISKELDSVSLYTAVELHNIVRIFTCTSMTALISNLQNSLTGFRSRMGALLFLFSALLSRGLDTIQSDRDDPGQPLVSMPFGHASQEIVNLLICGEAVSNVFDGNMDFGGGMRLKGIPHNVEVGFLTLLEALNLCKVGQILKCPKWPIWVVGSESHYTVLFALECNVQEENELEDRERCIREAFDMHDQSGGGGFISAEALHRLIRDLQIAMPKEMLDNLCTCEIVVWNEFWQALCQIEKNKGGLKDTSGVSGKRQFELYHFNGIAKTVPSSSSAGDMVEQRPRLARLRVTVPPKWTAEEFVSGGSTEIILDSNRPDAIPKEEPAQHAPLVDCIRTRWQCATCNWSGDAPSIV